MKDFQDLIQQDEDYKSHIEKTKKNKADLMQQFEDMQKELRKIQDSQPKSKSSKIEEVVEDYDDELQDQMAESLFQEAN